MTSNNTQKDTVTPLSLVHDCCGLERRIHRLSEIHLELHTKKIVNRLEDLQLASHKVKEGDRLIAEQKWKMRDKFDNHISFLSYSGVVTTSLVMIIRCYSCCCCVVREGTGTSPSGGRTTILAPQ
jgi:hypothetical protein